MGLEGKKYIPGMIHSDVKHHFKGPVNSAVLATLEGRSHVIEAKRKVHSLSKTKEDALKLVEICEILRRKCIDMGLDYIPSYVSENNKNTWLKWDMYTLAPWNTTSMKQIEVGGQKQRVYNVFIRKIPMYQRFANHMLDTLDRVGIYDFGF